MNEKKSNKTNLSYIIISVISVIHLIITFFTDKKMFKVSPLDNLTDYIICKALTLVVLFFFYLAIYLVFIDKNRSKFTLTRALKAAFPYFLLMIVIAVFKLRGGFLSNDEVNIYANAETLTHYTWFYYITTYYYIISMMLIPHMYAPVFLKMLIEYIIVGYVYVRANDYFNSKADTPLFGKIKIISYGGITFLLFILYPILAYTTSAHRLPIYFLFYLLMICCLLFDGLMHYSLTPLKGFFLLLLGAVLTQWRTEGIYLVILLPLLMFLTYENIRHLKPAATVIVIYLLLQYVVSIPQNGLVASEMGAAADDRMKPFYAYTITNMYRNGLDFDKNHEDLAIVDKYLALDAIEAINDYYGDINYEDVLILFNNGYYGVREEATITDYFNFTAALKRIFKNNPEVFVRTRINAFKYAALPYHIELPSEGINISSGKALVISSIKTVLYNLFIPLIIAIVLCLYSLFRKRFFSFFLFGGILCHWFIVFVLAPASYFKYYFPVYITSYLYLILLLIQVIYNHKNQIKARVLR